MEKVQNIVKVELSIDISNVLNYTFSKKSRRRETCMTIKDIAKNLNVSYSTVSLSLNNDPRVAEKTKKRVIEEAERLGFTFNANARSLVTKKTNRIGIVFSDNFNAPDYRWFFNEIETYSTRAVENCGYDFLIQPNKNIHS